MAQKFKCAACGRVLKNKRWVYSRFTGNRYCISGCDVKRKKKAVTE